MAADDARVLAIIKEDYKEISNKVVRPASSSDKFRRKQKRFAHS